MSRKNHKIIDGRLIQIDKRWSQLKATQRVKIDTWLYEEYAKIYTRINLPPDSRWNDKILDTVYEKINDEKIWIPFGEVKRYFFSRKNAFRKRYQKKENESKTERQL